MSYLQETRSERVACRKTTSQPCRLTTMFAKYIDESAVMCYLFTTAIQIIFHFVAMGVVYFMLREAAKVTNHGSCPDSEETM